MLLDYYPRVVREIREMREICKAEQQEFENLYEQTERLSDNIFIASSDENRIARLEKEMGIVPTPGQDIEERRIAVLFRIAKKNLNFNDIRELIRNYSKEVDLVPDYSGSELSVIVGDGVRNVRDIYKTLDEILALDIYIYPVYETMSLLELPEMEKSIEMETSVNWWVKKSAWFLDGSVKLDGSRMLNSVAWWQETELDLETSVRAVEEFDGFAVIVERNMWFLDGSVKLNGRRLLNAKRTEEAL